MPSKALWGRSGTSTLGKPRAQHRNDILAKAFKKGGRSLPTAKAPELRRRLFFSHKQPLVAPNSPGHLELPELWARGGFKTDLEAWPEAKRGLFFGV